MCHKVRYNNLYLQIFNPYFYSDFTDFFIAEHNYVKLRNAFTTTLIHGRARFFAVFGCWPAQGAATTTPDYRKRNVR